MSQKNNFRLIDKFNENVRYYREMYKKMNEI